MATDSTDRVRRLRSELNTRQNAQHSLGKEAARQSLEILRAHVWRVLEQVDLSESQRVDVGDIVGVAYGDPTFIERFGKLRRRRLHTVLVALGVIALPTYR